VFNVNILINSIFPRDKIINKSRETNTNDIIGRFQILSNGEIK